MGGETRRCLGFVIDSSGEMTRRLKGIATTILLASLFLNLRCTHSA